MWKGREGGLVTNAAKKSYADRFTTHFQKGRDYLLQAVELDERFDDSCRAKKLEACELYKLGIDEFRKACEISTMEVANDRRKDVGEAKEKIDGFLKSAQERFLMLFNKLNKANAPEAVQKRVGALGSTAAASSAHLNAARTASPAKRIQRMQTANTTLKQVSGVPTKATLLKGVDPKFGERLLDEMLDSTGVRLSDVAGCDAAKSALEEAVILPSMNPGLFTGLRQPVKGILLFGPPGNGKTMLAKAVATESRQVFFNMSAASLTSKWVGDGEKTVRSLFQIARNAQPSIIFIDEIDSILCDRSEKDSEASRRMKTEFLVQFDGATSNSEDRILVIGATNRPHELDDAVLRRFPKRILLSLPDDAGRYTLVKSILHRYNMAKGVTDPDIRYIASRTSGYSNSDLVALCKEAAMVPVRSIDRTKIASTDNSKLRNLKSSDFDKALTVIKPSTNPKHMDTLAEFARRAGQTC